MEQREPPSAAMRALSLFSGCGGFCEGIKLAGFEIACAVELDQFAAITYRLNFPNVPLYEGDVKEFLQPGASHEDLYKLKGIDLVFGGPPCQGFSQIGPRDHADERNVLYEDFARIVNTVRPKVFLMENVPNLLLIKRGYFRDRILEKFKSIGYSNTTFLQVRASDYGVPQHRNRVFFVGTADEAGFGPGFSAFCLREIEELRVGHVVTVDDAISDLPAKVVSSGETMAYPKRKRLTVFQKQMRLDQSAAPYPAKRKQQAGIKGQPIRLHNHHTKEMLERRKKLISFLAPGAKADTLPKHIWNGARPEKWRRLDPQSPSYTILAQMHRDLSEWVHPHEERWITVREAARLQSFHDGFIFASSEWQQLKQIGNAVPPLLGFAAGRLAAEVLTYIETVVKAQTA